jgi:hypothetical protein
MMPKHEVIIHWSLRDALNAHPEMQARVFEALKRINRNQVISEGRVYGGGLHKVEPKELAQIPARLVQESIDAHLHIGKQEKLFASGENLGASER